MSETNYEIKDSGERRDFGEGLAVRDVSSGKGRCDLLPLDVASKLVEWSTPHSAYILDLIESFIRDGRTSHLVEAIKEFVMYQLKTDMWTMLLELAKHYENGCQKYGDRNWEKGMPVHVYIDSAVRHYLKHMRGDRDEPHHLAFVWNLFGAIWTSTHKPELIDLPFKETI